MRKSHTAAMEIFAAKANGPMATEPYEAGWAREALAVIYCHEVHGPAPRLELRAQISADGVRWIDFGRTLPVISEPGGCFLNLTGFGNWLRLAGTVTGGPDDGSATVLIDIYWVLKE